jgi:hypothetical protein
LDWRSLYHFDLARRSGQGAPQRYSRLNLAAQASPEFRDVLA